MRHDQGTESRPRSLAATSGRGAASGMVPLAAWVSWSSRWLVHQSGVSVADTLSFTAYVGLGLVFPGTVMWRMMTRSPDSSIAVDAVLGTSLAYAVELAVYLVCAHLAVPEAARFWPVVPAGGLASPRGPARRVAPRRCALPSMVALGV